jgi:hypothetical protein
MEDLHKDDPHKEDLSKEVHHKEALRREEMLPEAEVRLAHKTAGPDHPVDPDHLNRDLVTKLY